MEKQIIEVIKQDLVNLNVDCLSKAILLPFERIEKYLRVAEHPIKAIPKILGTNKNIENSNLHEVVVQIIKIANLIESDDLEFLSKLYIKSKNFIE